MDPYTIDLTNQCENSIKLLPQFDTYRTAYKHVNSQPIHAFFLIPKELPPGPRPLLVRFHGGAWSEGEAESFMRPFFLELALKHGAVILTPDYRIRPEHEITDLLEDIGSFWKWIERGDAQQVLRDSLSNRALQLDAHNLLVGGESGGGYITAQTALLGLTDLPIKVLFVQYPALDLARILAEPLPPVEVPVGIDLHLHQHQKRQKQQPNDDDDDDDDDATSGNDEVSSSSSATMVSGYIPYSVVEEHLAGLKPGQICTRAKFGSRMYLMSAMVQAGRLCDLSGEVAFVDPMIPWEHTEGWVEKLRRLYPDVVLHLVYLPTGEHVFDNNHTMETPWLKEPLEFVHKYWPAG
ncbi:putative alpha beta hydrolase fold-3 domain protein [Eutypa lata UCREL1]|uniref:Putative alpha beta hydrolase fold-3 domain protein n=1 Tax=Eutypa lata (strain UCR-EL1) TaxID=1287681 RepID=M7TMX9_EUTLA|nr:putative alpha beta hydrolase fold-3 domain protein [Eutypa lata UCREL1]